MRGLAIYLRFAAIFYLIAVLILCFTDFSTSEIELPVSFLGISIDKYIHFFMFLPFPFLMEGFFYRQKKCVRVWSILISGIALAAITELGQLYLIENRSCELYDFVADFLAVIVGIIIIRLLKIEKYICQ